MEIGISLSGGGFRAAMFHLGTLRYLHRLHFADDGSSLLDQVNTISTISGGSITGLWYMMQYCHDSDIEECFKILFTKLVDVDMRSLALSGLIGKRAEGTTLIRETITIYDQLFFHGETFGAILEKIDNGHIHHFCASGTDFSNGLPFRFQATRKIKNAKPEYQRGYIGNAYHHISSWDLAGELKLSEILAVSSCFPGGFEPVRFPEDFDFYQNVSNKNDLDSIGHFDLMDGGIVDNQGIDALLKANAHLSYDSEEARGRSGYPCLDLLIISDVANPMLAPSRHWSLHVRESLSLSRILSGMSLLSGLFTVLLICGVLTGTEWLIGSGATGIIWVGTTLFYVQRKIVSMLKHFIKRDLEVNWKDIKHIRLNNLLSLLGVRLFSLLHLSQAIFMKPIRQMRYQMIYENKNWHNRRITNNVSELSSTGSYNRKSIFPTYLIPSDVMKANSDLASSFGTTLWFSKQDKKDQVPEALLAAGMYTICMNLLEYIESLKADKANTNDNHLHLMSLEETLRADWEKFKDNPRFLNY